MSTLLPSFIVFLELKQAKFFWSVLLIFGKTEAFLFHFLYSSCLSLTHSVFHRLYIILYIWDAVFSMCGTNFHNGGAYNRTVRLGSHFLCLLRGGNSKSYRTGNAGNRLCQSHHLANIRADLASYAGNTEGGYTVQKSLRFPGDQLYPFMRGGRYQRDQIHAIFLTFRKDLSLFLIRKIRYDNTVQPTLPAFFQEGFFSIGINRIHIG